MEDGLRVVLAATDIVERSVRRLTFDESAEAVHLAERCYLGFRRQISYHIGFLKKGLLTPSEASDRGIQNIGFAYPDIFRRGMQVAGTPGILLSPQQRAALDRLIQDDQDKWRELICIAGRVPEQLDCDSCVAMCVREARKAFWLGFALMDPWKVRQVLIELIRPLDRESEVGGWNDVDNDGRSLAGLPPANMPSGGQ
jgi:hypothetical protein